MLSACHNSKPFTTSVPPNNPNPVRRVEFVCLSYRWNALSPHPSAAVQKLQHDTPRPYDAQHGLERPPSSSPHALMTVMTTTSIPGARKSSPEHFSFSWFLFFFSLLWWHFTAVWLVRLGGSGCSAFGARSVRRGAKCREVHNPYCY
jgi:hypothetical protein